MKANIVVGGLLGIALGAGVVFGYAHSVSPTEPVDERARPTRSEPVEQVSNEALVVDVPSGPVRQRPLRPGSARIGHPLQS